MAEVKQYVFFDFEMLCSNRGMPYDEMEAIRLGAVKQDIESGEIVYFDRFIRPKNFKRLSVFCKELTGISDEDLKDADSFKIVFEDFLTWIGGVKRSRFFSWSRNDLTRLILDAEKHEISSTIIKKIEKRYIDFQAIFTQRVSKNNLSVENALSLYGLTFEGEKHNPMYDALNTLRIYQAFQNRRVDSDQVMIKHFILNEKPFELEEVNLMVRDCMHFDIKSLLDELKDIYKLKDGKRLLKRIQRLSEKYSNILINRSGIFSAEVMGIARLLVEFYHELILVYEEHALYSARVMILPDGMINLLKKHVAVI